MFRASLTFMLKDTHLSKGVLPNTRGANLSPLSIFPKKSNGTSNLSSLDDQGDDESPTALPHDNLTVNSNTSSNMSSSFESFARYNWSVAPKGMTFREKALYIAALYNRYELCTKNKASIIHEEDRAKEKW